jgi:hypothetical protein
MSFVLQPFQRYLVILSGWIHRQQQEVIDYHRTENQVLKETTGKKRILLTNDQRRRLAVKGKILGRRRLEDIGTLFTPDTILRWHRMLVAKKWNYSDRRAKNVGRPSLPDEVKQLVLRFSYLVHYHEERNHQSFNNTILQPGDEVGRLEGNVECRERLGGLLRYYHRAAG